MPPNVTNNPTTNVQSQDQQVGQRKGLIKNGKVDEQANGLQTKNDQETTKLKAKTIVNKIINFVFYFSLILFLAVAFFIFVPWEDYIFDEHEIENYIDMYNEGEGDWMVRQFLATSEQNLTEPM